MSSPGVDRWAQWLGQRRDGGSAELRERMRRWLIPVRDRVLADAGIRAGDRVLDVGCGDGLIGFGVADLVGPGGVVVFSDISAELVEQCCTAAAELGIADRCEFLHTALPALDLVADRSVTAPGCCTGSGSNFDLGARHRRSAVVHLAASRANGSYQAGIRQGSVPVAAGG